MQWNICAWFGKPGVIALRQLNRLTAASQGNPQKEYKTVTTQGKQVKVTACATVPQ